MVIVLASMDFVNLLQELVTLRAVNGLVSVSWHWLWSVVSTHTF